MNKFKKETYIKQTQLPSGKWRFQVRIEKKNINQYFSETSYGNARIAYEEALRYRNKCLVTDISKAPIYKPLSEILNESYDLLPVREETMRKHQIYFNKYFKNKTADICSINKMDIITNLNSLIYLSDDMINRIFALWKRIFRTANIQGYIDYDLTQGITVPKSQKIQQQPKKVICSRDELNSLLMAIDTNFNKHDATTVKMALELMWYSGLRPGECFALDKADVSNGFVNVFKELGTDMASSGSTRESIQIVVRKCKTKASIRQVPISNKLQELLDEYVPTVKGKRLFPTDKGGYYNISSLGVKLHNLDKNFNMYQLRHTLATHLIVDAGCDERTVTEILGHEHINMSVYYARSNQDKKKDALNLL